MLNTRNNCIQKNTEKNDHGKSTTRRIKCIVKIVPFLAPSRRFGVFLGTTAISIEMEATKQATPTTKDAVDRHQIEYEGGGAEKVFPHSEEVRIA